MLLEIRDILSQELELENVLDKGFLEDALLIESENSETSDAEEVVEVEDREIYLGSVQELFEDYIGIPIVGYVTYQDDILDIERRVACKIITSVIAEKSFVVLNLSTPDAIHGGYIKIIPAINGQFSELKSEQDSSEFTRYRLKFYGGDSIEYIDQNNLGQIYYSSGIYNKS